MKKIGKITLKKDETLSDKELSAISDAIRTDCGSSYFYMDGNYYCTTHDQKCIDPRKKEENGSFKVGYCDTYTYEEKNHNIQVSCFCNIK